MVRVRDARYCNLKLLLMLLVVFGHWLEAGLSGGGVHAGLYRLIYLFHMPLFAFLTGLFVRTGEDCLRQIKRLLPLYLAAQTLAVLFGDGQVRFLTPVWHLWYLLSACWWFGAAWLLLRAPKLRRAVLAVSVIFGCLAGLFSGVDRTLSLSRTVVFFPYFWAGVLCSPEVPWHRFRRQGLVALLLALALFAMVGAYIPTGFLYQAAPYAAPGQMALRAGCYLLGGLLSFFLLTAIPRRRFPWSKAGADTLWLYLLHAPVVALLRRADQPWWLCLLLSVGLIFVLYQLLRWTSPLYSVMHSERRDRPWPALKPSTNNTRAPSTGSSSR